MDNKRQNIFIYVNSCLGITSNLLLLYFVVTDKTRNHFGYKRMLMIVTIYNIYYAALHLILDMGFVIDSYGFAMFSKTFANSGYTVSYMAVMVYMCAFTMSLTLLVIHCLYRYVQVSGRWQFIFEKRRWIFLLLLFHFGFGPIWCANAHITYHATPERTELSRQEVLKRYGVRMEAIGYIGPVLKWINPATGEIEIRWFNVLGSFAVSSILGIFYTGICLACLKLYLFIKRSLISEKAKKINYQLLSLLVIQATAPLFFEYVPVLVPAWGGLLGFYHTEMGVYITVLTSGYSLADSLMVIIGFKVYRQRLFALFRWKSGQKIVSSTNPPTLPKESTANDSQKIQIPTFT